MRVSLRDITPSPVSMASGGPKSQPGSLMSVGLGVETRAHGNSFDVDLGAVEAGFVLRGADIPGGCLCLLSAHGIEVERSCRIAVSVPEAPFVGRLLLAATPIRLGPVRAERIRVRPAPPIGKGAPAAIVKKK